jgi:ferredoxin-NADP reductase
MAKQPFYHRIDGLLFTATNGIDEKQFIDAIKEPLKKLGVLPDSITIEEFFEPEPGDPSDL